MIAQWRMNRVRDQVWPGITPGISGHSFKGTRSKSEEVILETAKLCFIFHAENSIGWNSFPDIELTRSVLLDSWPMFIQTNITQTAC